MYSKKDFIARPIVEDIQIWDSKDGKFYISTALIDGALFYGYKRMLYHEQDSNWEQILEGYDLNHCIELINIYES